MKQIIPDTKFNREYFIIGKAYVITVNSNQKHGILNYFEDDRLRFTVIGSRERIGSLQPMDLYVNKQSVESGETIIRQACAIADPAEDGEDITHA